MAISATLLAAACGWAALAQSSQSTQPFRPAVPEGLDAYMPVPAANELTPEKILLGRRLFFDPILSRDKRLACSTCHQPHRAFSDPHDVARGIGGRRGKRNVPAILNRVYGRAHFFDGRAATLEQQALEPLDNPDEFDTTVEEAISRLVADSEYSAMFRAAFSREPNAEDLARALASYTRTILAGGSPFDRYMLGDVSALTEQQREGLRLFRGRANCAACHVGPAFSDEQFHNTGVAWRNGKLRDPGRAAISGAAKDRGAFKTPSLRQINQTAPYMHDGSLPALLDVIDFYDRGGNPNPHLDPELRPLKLTPQEKAALLAFLGALDGRISEGLDSKKPR